MMYAMSFVDLANILRVALELVRVGLDWHFWRARPRELQPLRLTGQLDRS
jgi:hypothetical protein